MVVVAVMFFFLDSSVAYLQTLRIEQAHLFFPRGRKRRNVHEPPAAIKYTEINESYAHVHT